MSRIYPEPTPGEDRLGDIIEAAIHALNAGRPDVAHRYLSGALDPRRLAFVGLAMSANLARVVAAHKAGESDD